MKKQYTFIAALILLSWLTGKAQLERTNWIFGSGADPSEFSIDNTGNIGALVGAGPNAGALNSTEGITVVSDPNTGDLLFYTDGINLYNSNHQRVDPNLNTPNIEPLGADPSSSTAVTVVPVINCSDQYYIFSDPTNNGNGRDLLVHVYDAATGVFSQFNGALPTLNNPLSGVNVQEGIIAIPNLTNPFEYWLITKVVDNASTFAVYKISSNGIQYSNQFNIGNVPNNAVLNPTYSATRLNDNINVEVAWSVFTAAPRSSIIMMETFNTQTGTFNGVGNTIGATTFPGATSAVVDLEYSINGQYLYYGCYGPSELYQIDLNNNNSISRIWWSGQGSGWNDLGGGLQTGVDGNIYHVSNAGWVAAASQTVGRITNTGSANPNYNPNVFQNTNTATRGFGLPNFTSESALNTILTSTEESICPGETAELAVEAHAIISGLDVNINHLVQTYEWFLDGQLIEIGGNTLEIDETGSYQSVVTYINGCQDIATIEVEESNNCCLLQSANINELQQILADQIISSGTVWEGKILIGDNITVTVDAAELDITNVDVVFGKCAAIVFNNGATLKANNSVFRPCDLVNTWHGLVFNNVNTVDVNSSTFINATMALDFQSTEGSVTNNLFENCLYGVNVDSRTDFARSITGNEFKVDTDFPLYEDCGRQVSINNNEPSGVNISRSEISGGISQNDFVSYSSNTSIQFHGIKMNASGATISQNNFSGNSTSIEANLGRRSVYPLNIEANTISVSNGLSNNGAFNFDIQISIRGGNQVWMLNNTISNGILNRGNTVRIPAVSLWNSNNFKVKENEISGFNTGISTINSTGQITSNDLLNNELYGIFSRRSDLNVMCNKIDMNKFNGRTARSGVGMFIRDGNGCNIHSNCIYDSSNPIYLFRNSGGSVRNNFLYNYSNAGLYVNNSQNIDFGTAISPGLNTFWSNSNTAIDVFCISGTMNMANNFGVNTFTFNTVNITQNFQYHSTASCAAQLNGFNQQMQLNTNLTCDDDENNPMFTPRSFDTEVISYAEILDPVYEEGTAVKSIESSMLEVYPNPAENELNVSLFSDNEQSEGMKLQVFNAHGQIVLSQEMDMVIGKSKIDVSGLVSGYYSIVVSGDAKVETISFIKK
ncbi:MAG: hypothetical protein CMP61_01240 [Flavobacteriales bacterium]|nr:hypothetical protein [Flavobacteriales bacterium]|tara:strand:+ start:7916 stop:11266 length:3351 start_codon:yes stop_codon:yes gene_type:complete